MKRLVVFLTAFAAVSLIAACGESGANVAVKPANSAASNANASSAVPGDPKAAEAEVRKVMESIKDGLSRNDADAMDKVYADNYTIVNADGSMMNKSERLAAIRSGDVKFTSWAYSEDKITVSPDGNSAVGIFKITAKGTMNGKPLDGDTRTTGTFAKTANGWRLMSASNVKIEGGAKPDDKSKMASNANAQPAANKMAANTKKDAMAADEVEPVKKK